MRRVLTLVLGFSLLAGVALAADAPPISEYDNVPVGILLTPEQRAALQAKTPVATDTSSGPAIDPQVPTHSVDKLTGDTNAPLTPTIQGIDQIEKAYAEGRYAEILTPLEELVAQGDMAATLMLGVMLETGQGGVENLPRAAALMTRAAEGGLAVAQHRLAIMHYQGRGVAQDDVRAMMWLHIAVAKYPPGAQRDRASSDRANLDANLTRRDRDTALFMAKEWLTKRGEAHLLDVKAAP